MGRKGREYLNGGVKKLISAGGYESYITCNVCGENFLMNLDSNTVDLFIKYYKSEYKGEVEYEDCLNCNKCGGAIEGLEEE